MPFNFPDYSQRGNRNAVCFVVFHSYFPFDPVERKQKTAEKKSSSFDTDAVVLLPLFMKCLFCFFNEIFNVKLPAPSFLLPHSELRRKGSGKGMAEVTSAKTILGSCFVMIPLEMLRFEGEAAASKKGITSEVFPHTHSDSGMRKAFSVHEKTIF